jgi:carboxypeptidase Taq
VFPAELKGVPLDTFYRAINKVSRSLIRTDADEVTYNLHILLRFELEVELIEERVAVADLPEAWNTRMEQYIGYTPKDDLEGVMQDVHWSEGLFGYFPTYTLGNLYSAAIRDAMAQDLSIDDHVRAGEFAPILAWLRDKVHAVGAVPLGEQLMIDVTGKPLQIDSFMNYLETKYSALYGL